MGRGSNACFTPQVTVDLYSVQALEWLASGKSELVILTNLHVDLDYKTLKSELREGIDPAYDGMTTNF